MSVCRIAGRKDASIAPQCSGRYRCAHRQYDAAFARRDDDGWHATSCRPHPALRRGRDHPGPDRQARGDADDESPPPGSWCTIGL